MTIMQRCSVLLIITVSLIASNNANSSETYTNGTCPDTECKDNSEKCEKYTSLGECTRNPVWMLENCKVSCNACPRTKGMPSYEDAEEIYRPLDDYDEEDTEELEVLALAMEKYGVAQNMRKNKRIRLVEIFTETEDYMKSMKDVFSQDILDKCVNESPSCAIWALRGKCKSNVALKCAPICKSCDKFLTFGLDGETSQMIDNLPDKEVLERIKQYGVAQVVEGESRELEMKIVRMSLKYIYNLKGIAPEGCTNNNELCAFWASGGECQANPEYMNDECKLSCVTCNITPIEDEVEDEAENDE